MIFRHGRSRLSAAAVHAPPPRPFTVAAIRIRKKGHSAEFKFKVAIEAIRGEKTMVELCREYSVVSSQIFKWKKDLLEKGKEVFSRGGLGDGVQENQIEKLHTTIARLTVENHFLAKCAGRGL